MGKKKKQDKQDKPEKLKKNKQKAEKTGKHDKHEKSEQKPKDITVKKSEQKPKDITAKKSEQKPKDITAKKSEQRPKDITAKKSGQKAESITVKKSEQKTEKTSFVKRPSPAGRADAAKPDMATVLRAFGDVHRLQILDLLKEQELTAGALLESMDIVQSTLSHHMKLLVEAGIVKCRKQGKWSYYSIDRDKLLQVSEYILSI